MRKLLAKVAVLAAVLGCAFGVTGTAQAQSATFCVDLQLSVNGTPVGQTQCVTLPPA